MVQRILQRLSIGFYLLFFKRKNSRLKDADHIVWSYPRGLQYFGSTQMLKEYAVRSALSAIGIPFKVERSKIIGKYFNKIIYITYARATARFGFEDYTRELHNCIVSLEAQGNTVYPSSYEFNYWENKVWMHTQFKVRNISHPVSHIVRFEAESQLPSDLQFPFLVKRVHSAGGKDIYKVENEKRWQELRATYSGEQVILQEFLDIRRDMRINFAGNEIVHHYWRINNAADWKPTSTGFGSSVDFEFFPEQWREFILNEFKKLDIITGGMDVTWRNDDLNTQPLILEISPSYQLNPVPLIESDLARYGKYKKSLSWAKHAYIKGYIDISFTVMQKVIQAFLVTLPKSKVTT